MAALEGAQVVAKNVTTDFGANNLAGDGLTNDYTKLAAILAASSAGDVLWFPTGTYLLSSTLTCKDGVHMRGPTDVSAWLKGKIIPGSNMQFTYLKLGDDSSTGFGRNGGAQAGITDGMQAVGCHFLGRVSFQPGDTGQNNSLRNSLFQGCTFLRGTHNGNSVNLFVFGDNTNARHYNVTFRECTWEGAARMNVEVTCLGTSSFDFAYPWYNISFYDCDFGPSGGQNLSLCGRRAGYWAAPYSGAFECGQNSTMSGCYIHDAGVNPPSGTNRMPIEAMMLRGYTFTNNVFGRNRAGQVTGTHMQEMIETGVDDLEHKTNAGYDNEMYNVITNNVFDGSGSTASTIRIKGGHNTFSGNTVIQQVCQGFQNANDCTIEGNDFSTVNSDGSLSTSRYAMLFADCDDMAVTGNTFRSKNSETVLLCDDWTAPTGPATDIAFVDNTFVKDAGDSRIEVVAGSSKTESGSVDVAA